jgi:hypothetical protein
MTACSCCRELRELDAVKIDSYEKWNLAYEIMRKLREQNKLKIYIADTSFDHYIEEIRKEEHYTYNIYVECVACKQIYYIGVCIRGAPIFKINEKPDKESFKALILADNKTVYEE